MNIQFIEKVLLGGIYNEKIMDCFIELYSVGGCNWRNIGATQ